MKTYEAIVKGQNIPTPGVPESFRVLVKELQSLGLDIRVLDEDGAEIELSQIGDDLLDDDKGYVTAEDVGPAVLDDEDVEGLNMVDEDEVAEDFQNADEEDFFDDFEDEDDSADFDEE